MALSRITARQLEIFVAVARTESTVAASLALGLSQSATSSAINELERALGVKFFDRVQRRLVLNVDGQDLMTRAFSVLNEFREIEAGFAGRGAGDVVALPRIAASTTVGNYILPRLIATYGLQSKVKRDALALASIRISNTADAVEAIEAGTADIALIEGSCPNPRLAVWHWMNDELQIVASPSHPLARAHQGRVVPYSELADALWLLREPGSGTREAVEHALLPHVGQLREGPAFGSTEAIKHAAVEGLGIACLSEHSVEQLIRAGLLVALATPLQRLVRNLFIVHRRGRGVPESVAKFLEFCQAFAGRPDIAGRIAGQRPSGAWDEVQYRGGACQRDAECDESRRIAAGEIEKQRGEDRTGDNDGLDDGPDIAYRPSELARWERDGDQGVGKRQRTGAAHGEDEDENRGGRIAVDQA